MSAADFFTRQRQIREAAHAALVGLIALSPCNHADYDPPFSGNGDADEPNDCDMCAAIGPLARLLERQP